MAATAKIPLLGKHLTTLTITPLTVNASTGALSSATSSAVSAARLRTNIDFQLNPQSEEINDDASTWANNVTTYDDWTLSVDLLPFRTAAIPFPLLDLMDQFEYFMVDAVFAAAGSTYPVKWRGKRGNIGVNSNGRGAFREALNLMCIDSGDGADASLVIG